MRLKLMTVIIAFCTILIFASCGNTSLAVTESSSPASLEKINSSEQENIVESSSEEAIEEDAEIELPDGDFRVGFWGDDAETIKKYETDEICGEDESSLIYASEVAGDSAYAFYFFDEEGALYQGGYQFTDTYMQGSIYISHYNILKDSLISKYGEPELDEVTKLSRLAEYADEGGALQLGYTAYMTKWTVDNTEILLAMMNQTGDVVIMIYYTDINHEEIPNTEGL